MIRRAALALMGLLLLALPARAQNATAPAEAANATLRMAYAEGFAPFSWTRDGKVTGILPDIMDEACRRMGLKARHEALPGNEVLFRVRSLAADGFLSAPAPEYEAIAVQSARPVLSTSVTLFVSLGSEPLVERLRLLKDLDGLKGLRLGASQYDSWSRQKLAAYDLKIYPSLGEAVAALARDEVQVMAQVPEVVEFQVQRRGLSAQVLRVPGVFLEEIPFHLFLNKFGGMATRMAAFDKALESMRADGTLLAILTRPR